MAAPTITIAPVYTRLCNQSLKNGGEFSTAEMGPKDNISGTADGRIPFPLPTDTQNLSSACTITNVRTQFEYTSFTNSSYSAIKVDFYTRVRCFAADGTIFDEEASYTNFDYKYASTNNWGSNTHDWPCSIGVSNVKEIGSLFRFVRGSDIYSWFKVKARVRNLKIGYTRTRRCYVTFRVDSKSERQIWDYGTVPAYSGGTPAGGAYKVFAGWRSSLDGKLYKALPAAGEVDVAYTAEFEDKKFTVTVKASPEEGGTVTGGGAYAQGTHVTLTAKSNPGYRFDQWIYYTYDGFMTSNQMPSFVTVVQGYDATYTAYFKKDPPKITSVSLLYNSRQISETNKVPAGQSFLISVGVE